MKKDYQKKAACATTPALPQAVTVALAELAGDVQEGLLAMAVGTGRLKRPAPWHHQTGQFPQPIPVVDHEQGT